MFTGLIEEVGRLRASTRSGERMRLVMVAPRLAPFLRVGDSVAVDGVCLTATRLSGATFEADATGPTLAKTTLPSWRPGRALHLERAARADGRLDGHVVQGHVVCVGLVESLERRGASARLVASLPADRSAGIAAEGSIALDGASLTIASARIRRDGRAEIVVSLVPRTLAATKFGATKAGDAVNVETDALARAAAFAAKIAAGGSEEGGQGSGVARGGGGIGMEDLGRWGYA